MIYNIRNQPYEERIIKMRHINQKHVCSGQRRSGAAAVSGHHIDCGRGGRGGEEEEYLNNIWTIFEQYGQWVGTDPLGNKKWDQRAIGRRAE